MDSRLRGNDRGLEAWMMKRVLCLILVAFIGVAFLGCGKKSDPNTLFIYNWTYYMPEQVIRNFEAKFHVKVVYDVFSSNEEMFAKLKAGAKGYDIVFPSGDYAQIMIREKMLKAIDKTKIPNFNYIDPMVFGKMTYDPGCVYSMPYMMAAAGIAVNTDYVKHIEHNATIFNRADLNGRMTLLDDMREVLGLALEHLGYSVNTTNPKELAAAKELVKQWKQHILKFDAEGFAKGFASGEYWVVQGYAESVFLELDPTQSAKVDFFIPEDGGPMYIDNMVILKDAPHPDLALQFINYIYEPAVYAQILDYLKLPSIHTAARKLVKNKPHYSLDALKNCEIKADLGPALDLYNRVWEEIRI